MSNGILYSQIQIDILKDLYGDYGRWYDVEGAKEELVKRIRELPPVVQAILGLEE